MRRCPASFKSCWMPVPTPAQGMCSRCSSCWRSQESILRARRRQRRARRAPPGRRCTSRVGVPRLGCLPVACLACIFCALWLLNSCCLLPAPGLLPAGPFMSRLPPAPSPSVPCRSGCAGAGPAGDERGAGHPDVAPLPGAPAAVWRPRGQVREQAVAVQAVQAASVGHQPCCYCACPCSSHPCSLLAC